MSGKLKLSGVSPVIIKSKNNFSMFKKQKGDYYRTDLQKSLKMEKGLRQLWPDF